MNTILGDWKLKSLVMLSFEGDTPVSKVMTRDELLASDDKDMAIIAASTLTFLENGTAEFLMELPAGTDPSQLDEEERAMLRDGNKLAFQSNAWKEEEGKFLWDSGEEREVMGEKLSPWDEIIFNPDGTIILNSFFKMTFER